MLIKTQEILRVCSYVPYRHAVLLCNRFQCSVYRGPTACPHSVGAPTCAQPYTCRTCNPQRHIANAGSYNLPCISSCRGIAAIILISTSVHILALTKKQQKTGLPYPVIKVAT